MIVCVHIMLGELPRKNITTSNKHGIPARRTQNSGQLHSFVGAAGAIGINGGVVGTYVMLLALIRTEPDRSTLFEIIAHRDWARTTGANEHTWQADLTVARDICALHGVRRHISTSHANIFIILLAGTFTILEILLCLTTAAAGIRFLLLLGVIFCSASCGGPSSPSLLRSLPCKQLSGRRLDRTSYSPSPLSPGCIPVRH
jgi:hypothetical protein